MGPLGAKRKRSQLWTEAPLPTNQPFLNLLWGLKPLYLYYCHLYDLGLLFLTAGSFTLIWTNPANGCCQNCLWIRLFFSGAALGPVPDPQSADRDPRLPPNDPSPGLQLADPDPDPSPDLRPGSRPPDRPARTRTENLRTATDEATTSEEREAQFCFFLCVKISSIFFSLSASCRPSQVFRNTKISLKLSP